MNVKVHPTESHVQHIGHPGLQGHPALPALPAALFHGTCGASGELKLLTCPRLSCTEISAHAAHFFPHHSHCTVTTSEQTAAPDFSASSAELHYSLPTGAHQAAQAATQDFASVPNPFANRFYR